MTRGDIRTFLRRRLNEQVADSWNDDTLNTLINLAYAMVLKKVRRVDPEAVLFWDYRNTVANEHWYEKPTGTRGIAGVGLKKLTTDTKWEPLTRKPYHIARDYTSADETVYCHRGIYIGIFPAPSVAVTKGLELVHAPTDTMSADTDVPKVETTLHYAIVCWALLLAKGESPEDDSKDARELKALLGDIEIDYGMPDLGQSVAFSPDVSDARGFGVSSPSSNGVYER